MSVTTDEVMALREEIGFRSPIRPMERGDKGWLLFSSRGTYEWAFHVDDAIEHLSRGIEVDGKLLKCEAVDVLPLQNAIQIRAQDPDREMGFVPATTEAGTWV